MKGEISWQFERLSAFKAGLLFLTYFVTCLPYGNVAHRNEYHKVRVESRFLAASSMLLVMETRLLVLETAVPTAQSFVVLAEVCEERFGAAPSGFFPFS